MTTQELNALINERRKRLVSRIEEVCNWIDVAVTADSYQLFQSDGYKTLAYNATKALNGRIKTLLRRIPNLRVISRDDIYTIVHQGMLEVREKHEKCGADESEVTWAIDRILDKFYETIGEGR